MSVFRGKKQLLFLASFILLVLWSSKLSAQSSATTTFSVKLDEIQSITLSPTQDSVEYSTINDYVNGFSRTIANHLTVNSTGDFTVSVIAGGTTGNLTGSGTNTLPLNKFTVTAALSTTTGGLASTNITTPTVTLSNTSATLIGIASSADYEGVVNGAQFNITYGAGALSSVTNEPDTYTVQLTYSILPG